MPFRGTAETTEAEGNHMHVPIQQVVFPVVVGYVKSVTYSYVGSSVAGEVCLFAPGIQFNFQSSQVVKSRQLLEITQFGMALYLCISWSHTHSSDTYERHKLDVTTLEGRILERKIGSDKIALDIDRPVNIMIDNFPVGFGGSIVETQGEVEILVKRIQSKTACDTVSEVVTQPAGKCVMPQIELIS